jgi:hypothetical protein
MQGFREVWFGGGTHRYSDFTGRDLAFAVLMWPSKPGLISFFKNRRQLNPVTEGKRKNHDAIQIF